LTFSTRDPLANYREGIGSRSAVRQAADVVGWSPFDWFRRHPLVAPATALAASATSFMTALSSSATKKPAAPAAPSPVAAPAKTSPYDETPKPQPYARTEQAPKTSESSDSAGDEDGEDLLRSALKTKQISGPDFNRVVNLRAGAEATRGEKTALGAKLLAFLTNHGVKVADQSSVVGSDKTFRDYVSEALSLKSISKRDLGRAVDLQAGPGATPQTRQAVAKKVVDFLAARGVEVKS
jgi:hypothetical protein